MDDRTPCADGTCRLPAGAGGQAPVPVTDPADWTVRRRRAVRRAAAGRVADRQSPRRVTMLMLDMGGVVIPTLFESVAVDGFPAGPLRGERDYARVEQGEITELDYWRALVEARPSYDIGEFWRRCSYVRDELRGALDAIAGRVRIVAFTNDMVHWFGEGWRTRFPEMAAFDAIVEAKRLGVSKPDPEAFRRAAAAVGERAEQCLFVDDLHTNLDGAAAVGMHTRLFDVRDPAGSVRAILGDLELDAGDVARAPRAFARGAARDRSATPATTPRAVFRPPLPGGRS